MNLVAYETANLEKKLSELVGILIGRGVAKGDVQRALEVEAGQCAWRIAQQLGPSSSATATRRLNSEMSRYVTSRPTWSNLDENQKYSSTSDFTWLYAGPRFVAGINDEDDQTDLSVSDAVKLYSDARKLPSRGNAWITLGKRGKQAILRVNRIHLKQATLSGVRLVIASKFGQSKATFVRTAMRYLRRSFPAWVTRQVPTVIENGKAILDESQLRSSIPSITFGSRAPGVESNPKMVKAIQNGVKQSEKTLAAKVRKMFAGQTYNWNTGQVFKPTNFEDN